MGPTIYGSHRCVNIKVHAYLPLQPPKGIPKMFEMNLSHFNLVSLSTPLLSKGQAKSAKPSEGLNPWWDCGIDQIGERQGL